MRSILLVNYEYPPVGGGAANATYHIARALVGLGQPVSVMTSGLRGAAGSTIEDSVRVHRLPVRRARPEHGTPAEMARFLALGAQHVGRIARAEGVGATIAFFTLPSGAVSLALRLQRGTPYLVSLRGSDVPGHDRELDVQHALTRPLRRAVLRGSAAIVANSEGLAATSRRADPFPVQIVPNGVDCAAFQPTPARAPGERVRFLFVGRLHRDKNPGVILSQFAALPERVRARCEVTFAGDGPLRTELEAQAIALGLGDRVHWLGWQAKPALPALYRGADVLINPSNYEGMPNVVLEAMASGLPIIASDIPGNRSVVNPQMNGRLFDLARPATLGAAVRQLAEDGPLRSALGAAGRVLAQQKFSWQHTARCYLELLGKATPKAQARLRDAEAGVQVDIV